MKVHKSLDLVHPCYNPHPHWAQDLVHYYGLLVKMLPLDLSIAVYVVNDGSSHGIDESDIQYLRAKIPHFYPCITCGPVAPASLGNPCGTVALVSPFNPCIPCGPVAPAAPVSPF